MSDETKELLEARNKTHGDWALQSLLAQSLKQNLRGLAADYTSLSASQREALEHICIKMSRIACGDPNTQDHWDDIKGYAELGKAK